MHFITERYLAYLTMMQSLSIDLASEYLVMAAVLVHIKSKMLLPTVPAEQADDLAEEGLDPREELVRRLLEYQRYRTAGLELSALADTTQDVFPRPAPPPPPPNTGPLAPMPIFSLLDAFEKLLQKRKVKPGHEVSFDRLTITDRINELTDVLRTRRRATFEQLFEKAYTRFDLVITFLALLEMSKLRLTRLFQADVYGSIFIEYALGEATAEDLAAAGDAAGAAAVEPSDGA
jgi:segregation and condensation protein A